jgi:uncharacterized membrane protein YeiH
MTITETLALGYIQDLLFWVMLVAVAVSAISGVLVAGKHDFDLFGMIIIALVAALGGGSVRDVLLNIDLFWIHNQLFVIVAILSGIGTFFYARHHRISLNLILVPDAIGLATFSVAGTMKALSLGAPWLVASLMGVVTGVVGGMLRDILCNETPIVFRSTLYATAAWAGGLLYIALNQLHVDSALAAAIAGLAIFLIRMAAIKWGLTLPAFRAKD